MSRCMFPRDFFKGSQRTELNNNEHDGVFVRKLNTGVCLICKAKLPNLTQAVYAKEVHEAQSRR